MAYTPKFGTVTTDKPVVDMQSGQYQPSVAGKAVVGVGPSEQDNGGFSLGKTVGNIIPSGINLVGGMANAIAHPIDTVKSLGKIALGGAEKLIPGQQGHEQNFDAIANFYKERYGGIENLKKTIQNDPVGVLADLSAVLDLGGSAIGTVGKLGEAAGVSKLGTLGEVGKTISSVGKAVDPMLSAGRIFKGVLNKGTDVAMATQRGLSPVLAGVPSEAIGALQKASREAIPQIVDAMRNRAGITQTIENIQRSTKALDDMVWKVGDQIANSTPGHFSGAPILDNALQNLVGEGIIVNKVIKDGVFKGFKVDAVGPLSSATVKSYVVPALMDIKKLGERGPLTTAELWKANRSVQDAMQAISKGNPQVMMALQKAVQDIMPPGFWEKIQQQDQIRQVAAAAKAAFKDSSKSGYGAIAGKGAMQIEPAIGQLFQKGKTAARGNIARFESALSTELQKYAAAYGKSVEDLVKSGQLDARTAELMRSPQITNRVLGYAFSDYMPNVLRALSSGGGSINALAGTVSGGLLGGIPGAALGFSLGSPRLQGEIALALNAAKGAGGFGNFARGSRIGRAIATGSRTAELLRNATNPNAQPQ